MISSPQVTVGVKYIITDRRSSSYLYKDITDVGSHDQQQAHLKPVQITLDHRPLQCDEWVRHHLKPGKLRQAHWLLTRHVFGHHSIGRQWWPLI